MMVKGCIRKAWGIAGLLGLMSGVLVGQDIPRVREERVVPDYSNYVLFDAVSFDRIHDRQKYISSVLDDQASTRMYTVIGLSAATITALFGGGIYWYYQYNKPAQALPARTAVSNRRRLEERYWERFEEAHTFTGAIKNGLRNGFGYAVASISSVAAMALFDKAGLISWNAVKDSFYPTTAVLCEQQELFFKRHFDYLNEALHEFEQELTQVRTPVQLEQFIKWRGLMSVDVQTSVSGMVRSVEDFAALSFEFMLRQAAGMPEDELPVHKFKELAVCIDELAAAVNDFTLTLELAVNITDITLFERNKTAVNMTFKNAVHAARNAMRQLQILVATV